MRKHTQSAVRWHKRMFLVYVVFLATLSVSVLLMPFGLRMADKTMALTYTAGALFWLGLLGTLVVAGCLAAARRRDKAVAKTHSKDTRCSWLRFFQNVPATVCDVVLIASAVGLAATSVWAGTTVWPFLFLSLFLFSFGMHGMLNGSEYTYVQS